MTIEQLQREQAAVEAALDRFRDFLAEVCAKKDALTEAYHDHPQTLLEREQLDTANITARQLTEGYAAEEGMEPRLWKLVHDPEVVRLGLAAPCIASLERLHDKLRAGIEEAQRPRGTWPRRFRYVGPGRHLQHGRYLKVGEEVELSETQAEAFRDRFTPVEREAASVSG